MSDGTSSNDGDLTDEEPADPEALVGEMLADRYRIDAHVGGGGMGEVYRAEHVMMKKRVAVKVLRPEVAGRQNVAERFRREAQAAANIDHRNVCGATDFGRTDDGAFFLVMEYLEGETLKDVLERRGRLSGARVVEIADEIAAALERAHELGVVHRDLKPENVMLVEAGAGREVVKVLDFGVSRVQMAEDMPSLTKTGAIFGTPDYMAPEQAGGETVDHRADLYALGAVMYELLAGRPVFEAEQSIRVMAAHLEEQPVRLSRLEAAPAISPELEELVMTLLEKDPDKRPESATDLRGRLAALRQGGAVRDEVRPAADGGSDGTHTIEIQVPTRKWVRRARDRSRELLERLDEALWFESDLRRFDRETVAAFGVLAAACLLFVAVVVLVVSGFGGGKSPEVVASQIDKERQAYVEKVGAVSALAAIEDGREGRAIDQLEKLEREGKSSPHLAFLLGQARIDQGDWSMGLEAYATAVDGELSYILEPTLLRDLLDARGSSDEAVAEKARSILKPHLSGGTMARALAEIAWGSESDRRRNQAHELLREHDLLDELPEVERLSVKLRYADGCDAHKKWIERLVALEDPRGLEVLRVFDEMPRRGCGFMNTKDCYGCIRQEISEAIETLERYE